MPEKKPWSEQQDKILRYLFQEEKITKWSKIAQTMAQKYHILGRNGKQCRQRYQSVLQPNSTYHYEWTEEEEKRMYELHDQYGNKWAQIAHHMAGRTDNCVKNHFYSNLRKAIRKMNKVILENFRSQIKQIRPIVLYKIIQATDKIQTFKQTTSKQKVMVSQQVHQAGKTIKNQLLQFASDSCSFENNLPKLKRLGLQIQQFSKDYKRKPKKDRRGVAQSLNLMKVPKIDKFKCTSDVQDDDLQLSVAQEQSIQIGQKENNQNKNVVFKKKQVIQLNSFPKLGNSDQQSYNKGIQMMLKNAGILHGVSINSSINSSIYRNNQLTQSLNQQQRQKNEQMFLLSKSVQNCKHSFVMRQSFDSDIDKLFVSNQLKNSLNHHQLHKC